MSDTDYPHWLHPAIRGWMDLFRSDETDHNRTDLLLSQHEGRVFLDRRNVEYVVSFLRQTPRVCELLLNINVDRRDGAFKVLIDFLRETEQITDICLWGDVNEATGISTGEDNGSLLQCIACGLTHPSVMQRITFGYNYDLRTRANRLWLKILFRHKRDLRKIVFQDCVFLPREIDLLFTETMTETLEESLEFLTIGISAQQELQDFSIISNGAIGRLSDEQTAHIVDTLTAMTERNPTALQQLTLRNCNVREQSMKALSKLLLASTQQQQQQHQEVGDKHHAASSRVSCVGGLQSLDLSMDRELFLTNQFVSALYKNDSLLQLWLDCPSRTCAGGQYGSSCTCRNRMIRLGSTERNLYMAHVRHSLEKDESSIAPHKKNHRRLVNGDLGDTKQPARQQQDEEPQSSASPLGLWGKAMGVLAQKEIPTSLSPMFLVVAALAPQLAGTIPQGCDRVTRLKGTRKRTRSERS